MLYIIELILVVLILLSGLTSILIIIGGNMCKTEEEKIIENREQLEFLKNK